jgi:ABC-type oligopeptide transport system substrate-binding subunit
MIAARLRQSGVLAATIVLAAACSPREESVPDRPVEPAALRRGLGAEPDTLDPQQAEDNAALAVLGDLYEGLARSASDGTAEPGAAESWGVSSDGRTYVFHLRHDLRWSNGDALTAAHFAAPLVALTAPGSLAPQAGLFATIERVVVEDDRTLRVQLARPVPYLADLLALAAAAPRHPTAAPSAQSPGNGAFRLRQRIVGEQIALERNPYYWDAARVALDTVVYRTITDLGTELNLYRTGELDITSEVPNTQVTTLRAERPAELHVTPYLGTYSYVVNLARLPDRDARRALAMAVDRERITRQVTGAGERPAYGWIPDGIPAYAPARFPWQALQYPDAAREARTAWAAASARGAAPKRLALCTDASANHHRTAVALADLWHSALGVDTEIIELEWTVYLDRRRSPGDCDLVRLGWSADFIAPEAFASVFESGHPQNTLGYRSVRYDSLLERSRTAPTPGERMTLIASAEAQLLDDVAVIPIFFRVSKRLVSPGVVGVQANPLGQLASRDLRLRQ